MTSSATNWICETCGTQYAASAEPPAACPVCTDDRQHVGLGGQTWTTHDELAATFSLRIERDGDLLGVGIREGFGIPQRALLVTDPESGNTLWDCVSVVTDEAVDELSARGGVDRIAISHPHFYSSMVEWSDAFGGVPILLHEADRDWVRRSSPAIEHWSGDRLVLSAAVTLHHLPGHFPGSSALRWTEAPGGRTALLTGDSLHVAADRRHISVMHSVPNHVPVGPSVIDDIDRRLAGLTFDDVYGFTWGLNIVGGADDAVAESLARYRKAIAS